MTHFSPLRALLNRSHGESGKIDTIITLNYMEINDELIKNRKIIFMPTSRKEKD